MSEVDESSSSGPDTAALRDLILSLQKPVVFHGKIDDWEVYRWGLEGWGEAFGETVLPFRCGTRSCSSSALWEGKCSTEEMTWKNFLKVQFKSTPSVGEEEKWHYFDYKRVFEWFPDDTLKSVSWDKFGFPDLGSEDANLWIGNRGAHTPCHFDTYGVNLVAQIFGTKRWVLFPPKEMKNMRPTRVPYEESSVYSDWNFSCPLPTEFYQGMEEVYVIDLKPGDVLYVPQHWWHYVESLELAISINTWVPIKTDSTSHLNEAIVNFLMCQISKQLDETNEQSLILNPNEKHLPSTTMHESLNCVAEIFERNKSIKAKDESGSVEPPSKRARLELMSAPELSTILITEDAELVTCCKSDELKMLMDKKCCCLSKEKHLLSMAEPDFVDADVFTLHRVLNAFCHPDILEKVREKVLEDFASAPKLRYT